MLGAVALLQALKGPERFVAVAADGGHSGGGFEPCPFFRRRCRCLTRAIDVSRECKRQG